MWFGLLFFIPFMGMALSAIIRWLTGKMQDYGVE